MNTPWFPDETAPVRAGYYDTRRPNFYGVARLARRTPLGGVRFEKPDTIIIRLYWSGRVWKASKHSPTWTGPSLFCQRREWRGQFSHAKRT